ncbi:glycosyltransferase [Microbacterium invictum]|uniref:Glycosyltransferase involved in cell wall biosynthesis n=1 Tax=Microbacterium invictum TaxID=515415 RepID=A0AA40VLE3_9MICO|nr:glycosyltransferase family 2 protein [Microbacterium invictum]MBB4138737.1 glycosyltransferase involved in cell wall biosynthesis [Microbacterium invictum]
MSSPVVTVIVPGRDVQDYAADAISSLLEQTLTGWRAILVDDGSTDATGTLFDHAAASDRRFRVLHNTRPIGLGAARNLALDLVETPLVAFLDADDLLTPSALEVLVGALTDSGSDFAVGAYVRLRPDRFGRYAPGPVQPWVAAATEPARSGTTLADHPEVSGNIVAWSKVSRIEFWRRNDLRFPEGHLYEDQIVAQRMYTRARAFDVVPDVVVHWRERADGSSITQHTSERPVLVEYLAAMRSGLAVLDAAGHHAAAQARVRLILDMDVPPLVRIAQTHPDDEYRRTLGDFVRELIEWADADAIALDPSSAALRDAARLW